MKIKSNLVFNTSLLARHIKQGNNGDKVVIGGSQPEYMIIPAGSTIELSDEAWKKFAKAGEPLLKSGGLTITKAPKLSDDEQADADAKELAEAKVNLAKLSEAAKAAEVAKAVEADSKKSK
jgi:hypothetical protein